MITLTESAAKKVQDLRLEEGKPDWGLRLRVVGGGCSGFSYELGWEDAEQAEDQVTESQGVKVYVDPQSVQYVTGAEIDYVDSLYGSGFSVKNPNVKGTCGCGQSFQT
ncbi:MAG: iron-sulfur cluster insertion protein ErpA [Candidatus Rokubacteria bacterium]|nr:iron-sulfur cluster insertion protein ErpA [Candidatus Rokubacteria bacterium]